MPGTSTHEVALACWGIALTGGVCGVGLARYVMRRRDWKITGFACEEDVVLGDAELQEGQSVCIAPCERMLTTDPPGVVEGSILQLSRKDCMVTLHPETSAALRPSTVPYACTTQQNEEGTGGLIWPRIGAPITVSVTAPSAVYRFTARVRDLREDPAGTRIIVSRPRTLMRIQRRQHRRFDLDLPATFERMNPRFLKDSGTRAGEPSGVPGHGTVKNISGGGLRAQIGGLLRLQELDTMLKQFAPETTVRIRLPLPALSQETLLARVCESGRAVVPGGLTLQVTCQFLPMPAWEQERLIQQVMEVQRQHHRYK